MDSSIASETSCPKCGQAQPQEATPLAHCPRCGLARDKMKSFAEQATPVAAELQAAWTELVATWDEGARHVKFVDLARQLAALPAAARLYRAYGQSHPNDQAARVQLERVTKLVQVEMSTVVAARLPPAAMPYKKTMVMLAVVVVLALSAWLYLAVIGKSPGTVDAPGNPGTLEERQQRADAQRKELMRNNRQPPIMVAPSRPPVTPPASAPAKSERP